MSEMLGVVATFTAPARRIVQAYEFALDPTPQQIDALLSHCGGARFAYNYMLARVNAVHAQREAERTYGMAEQDLTAPLDWSAYSLRRLWNAEKCDAAPWWKNNSKEAYASGITNLANALKNWNESRSGRRAGRRVSFPKYKRKHSARQAFSVTTGSYGPTIDCRHIKVPRIGEIRTCESTRALLRFLRNGRAKVGAMTLSFRAGRWFAAFSITVDRARCTPRLPDSIVGVDIGLKSLAVLSTGEVVVNSRHYQKVQRQRRRLSRVRARRRGPDRKRGLGPSKRWQKANTRANRLERRTTAMRRDALHKLTTRLAETYGTVVVEDLNVSGMMRNRSLSKAIWSAGFGELRRQLEYKVSWQGGTLIKANRFFPSSKRCSGCGFVKSELHLGVRTYECENCSLVLDRDLNAAQNLVALGCAKETGP